MATFNFHSANNDNFFIGIVMIWVVAKGTVQPLCSFEWFTPDLSLSLTLIVNTLLLFYFLFSVASVPGSLIS